MLMALASLTWAIQVTGDLAAAEPVMDEALAIAREDGKLYRVSYLLGQQAFSGALLGRGAEADQKLAEGRAANPAFRDTFLLDFLGWVRLLTADLDETISAFRESLAWTGDLSRRRAYGAVAAVRALAEKADFDGAMQLVELSSETYGGRDWWIHSALPGWGDGLTRWLRGDGRPALDLLQATGFYMVVNGYWLFAGLVFADLAEAALDIGDGDLVTQAWAWAQQDPVSAGSATQRATAALTAACAHLNDGDNERAVDVLLPAAAAFATSGWAIHEGRSRALLGAALAPTDKTAARASLEAAVDLFDRSGAVVRRDRAQRAIDALGATTSRPPRAVTGPDALTKREREVARLAATGRSARDIADELFIGERTVETHLSNAYAKLGVSSKLELVRVAPSLDL
jgi:DNA-binding CsgD family transcriptional regulator